MASSFVSVNGKGFWITDGFLEIFLGLASLHIDDTIERDSIENVIRDQWLLASRGYFSGAVAFNLEKDISTKKGQDVVVKSIQSLLNALSISPPELDFNVINLLCQHSKWMNDLNTGLLMEIGSAILQLIDNSEAFKQPKYAIRLC